MRLRSFPVGLGPVAQLAEAADLKPVQCRFKSDQVYVTNEEINPQDPGTVRGYRKQSPENVEFVNRIKDTEFTLATLVNEQKDRILAEHGERSESMRQAAVAAFRFEEGFMHLVRSVFLPESPWER